MKLFADKECFCTKTILVAAKMAGVELELADPKACDCCCCCACLETEEGKLCGGHAIIRYIAKNTKAFGCGREFCAALVDQWMEFVHCIMPCLEAWVFPIAMDTPACPAAVKKAKGEIRKLMKVVDDHLLTRTFLVSERMTIADVAIFGAFLLPYKLVLDPGFRKMFKNLNRWFVTIAHQPLVAEVFGEVELCTKAKEPKMIEEKKAEEKPKKEQQPKQQPKKAEKKAEAEDDEEEQPKKEEKKPKNPLDLLPPSDFVLDEWKRVYSNEEVSVSIPWLWEHFDAEGFSMWFCKYKYDYETSHDFMVANGLNGWIQRLDPLRKYGFGSLVIFGNGTSEPFVTKGVWIFRGKDIPKEMTDCDDCELYDWTRVDPAKDKALASAILAWEGDFGGLTFNQGKVFK